jgi:hypothetical protein
MQHTQIYNMKVIEIVHFFNFFPCKYNSLTLQYIGQKILYPIIWVTNHSIIICSSIQNIYHELLEFQLKTL